MFYRLLLDICTGTMAMQNQFQITLDIPQFVGNQRDNIIDWFSRIEDTIRPIAADDNDLNLRLVSLLPQKLAGNAYKVYRSFPQDVKNNYQQCKDRLSAIFNNQDFIRVFQGSLTARTRQQDENIEVYVSELRSLTAQAFPDFTPAQKEQETLRRFIAGISPFLRGKCRENDVNTLDAAMRICKNAERAMKEYQSVDAPTADIGLYNNSLMQAQAAAPVSVLAQIESNDSRVTSHVLETVIDELRKLSTNTPGSQALLNEMRKQNETTQRLISELRDHKARDSDTHDRDSRSFARRRDSFNDQRPRYENRSDSNNRRRDGHFGSRSNSYDRQFNSRPRDRSQSNDRSFGNDRRRFGTQHLSRENRDDSPHGRRPYEYRQNGERSSYKRRNDRSASHDRQATHRFAARRSPYPSRSPSASRGSSPAAQRRVTFDTQSSHSGNDS